MESKVKTIKIDKAKYSGFLKKAKEFISSMEDDLAKERWNSACLNAIHSAISANDALLACFHGIRSISPKHDDAVRLLISLFKTEEARKNFMSRYIRSFWKRSKTENGLQGRRSLPKTNSAESMM
jgi:uncharacterized protein (UPF0332 family)